jgi:hypothetical protein
MKRILFISVKSTMTSIESTLYNTMRPPVKMWWRSDTQKYTWDVPAIPTPEYWKYWNDTLVRFHNILPTNIFNMVEETVHNKCHKKIMIKMFSYLLVDPRYKQLEFCSKRSGIIQSITREATIGITHGYYDKKTCEIIQERMKESGIVDMCRENSCFSICGGPGWNVCFLDRNPLPEKRMGKKICSHHLAMKRVTESVIFEDSGNLLDHDSFSIVSDYLF